MRLKVSVQFICCTISVHLHGTIAGMKYLIHSSGNYDPFFMLVQTTPTQAAAKKMIVERFENIGENVFEVMVVVPGCGCHMRSPVSMNKSEHIKKAQPEIILITCHCNNFISMQLLLDLIYGIIKADHVTVCWFSYLCSGLQYYEQFAIQLQTHTKI